MHRGSGIALLVALGMAAGAVAQAPQKKDGAANAEKKDEEKKPPPRPRVELKREPGGVGDDVPGGGAPTAPGSKGGTPGTPSGSFTR